MRETIDKISGYIIQYGLNLIAAILIYVIGRWAAQVIAQIADGAMQKAKVDKTLASFARTIIYFGMLTFVVVAALGQLGIQTTSFIALIGAAGLAVGLALQGSLANFASGVLLILFHTFKVGDVIEAAGALGTVHEIQIFNTILVTPDKKRVIIPNSKITGDKITIH